MSDFNLESKIDFAKKLSNQNIVNAYKYVIGLYEENKNYLDERENLKLLMMIIEFQQKINPQEDIDYFFKKALEYAIRHKDNDSIIMIYKFYCQILFKNAKLEKCELLIENFFSNFEKYASFQNQLELKEIDIAISSLLKENVKDEENFLKLIEENIQPDQIIKIIVSFCRKYISSLDEKEVLRLLNILRLGLKYIIKNKEHFKIYHYAFAELHNLIGNLYYYFGLFNKAQRHFLRAFMDSLSDPDVNLFSKFQKNISISLYELGEIEKANKYFFMIEKLYKKIDDPIVLNQFYSVLGLSYIRQGKYSIGHSILKSAIKYRMSIKDYWTLLHTLNYAIIFSQDRTPEKTYYYFLYFEKIVTKIPNSYYYLYYILYISIFRKTKFDSKLFLQKLIKFPIYSLRLIPLFSLCLKHKIKLIKFEKFLAIITLFKESFKNEIGEKNFSKFVNQFSEYKDLIDLKIDFNFKIKSKLPFISNNDKHEIKWNEFLLKDLPNLNERELIDILYIKLLEDGTKILYRDKYYILKFEYKNEMQSDFNLWVRKTLFSRINLDKIILIPFE
ncbi:MAG: Get4 family protein [Exilispira sp.]|jgi:hypothetical protein|nr:Get4 family protein [Exilispira sp.]